MYKNKKVTLVFPTYNEQENIQNAIKDFKNIKIFDEIIVVDNNSTDKTNSIARKCGAQVVNEKKQGYGFALMKGLKSAKGNIIILCEPDGTFLDSDTKKLRNNLKSCDCIIGSRTHKKYIKKCANMNLGLRLGNILLAKLIQILFNSPPLSDCGCTYRVMKKSVVEKVLPNLTVGSSHFLPELTINVIQEGFSIKEIPVHYKKRIGKSKITGSLNKTIKVGFNMLILILKLRFDSLSS